LNREPGRVERGHVVVVSPTGCGSGEHVAELRHVLAGNGSRVDGVDEVAVMAGPLPVVRVKPNAGLGSRIISG